MPRGSLHGFSWFLDKRKLQDQYVANVIAEKHFRSKPWIEMNQDEKRKRIRQLWTKVRMFVRLRRSLSSVQQDAENREIREHFNR